MSTANISSPLPTSGDKPWSLQRRRSDRQISSHSVPKNSINHSSPRSMSISPRSHDVRSISTSPRSEQKYPPENTTPDAIPEHHDQQISEYHDQQGEFSTTLNHVWSISTAKKIPSRYSSSSSSSFSSVSSSSSFVNERRGRCSTAPTPSLSHPSPPLQSPSAPKKNEICTSNLERLLVEEVKRSNKNRFTSPPFTGSGTNIILCSHNSAHNSQDGNGDDVNKKLHGTTEFIASERGLELDSSQKTMSINQNKLSHSQKYRLPAISFLSSDRQNNHQKLPLTMVEECAISKTSNNHGSPETSNNGNETKKPKEKKGNKIRVFVPTVAALSSSSSSSSRSSTHGTRNGMKNNFSDGEEEESEKRKKEKQRGRGIFGGNNRTISALVSPPVSQRKIVRCSFPDITSTVNDGFKRASVERSRHGSRILQLSPTDSNTNSTLSVTTTEAVVKIKQKNKSSVENLECSTTTTTTTTNRANSGCSTDGRTCESDDRKHAFMNTSIISEQLVIEIPAKTNGNNGNKPKNTALETGMKKMPENDSKRESVSGENAKPPLPPMPLISDVFHNMISPAVPPKITVPPPLPHLFYSTPSSSLQIEEQQEDDDEYARKKKEDCSWNKEETETEEEEEVEFTKKIPARHFVFAIAKPSFTSDVTTLSSQAPPSSPHSLVSLQKKEMMLKNLQQEQVNPKKTKQIAPTLPPQGPKKVESSGNSSHLHASPPLAVINRHRVPPKQGTLVDLYGHEINSAIERSYQQWLEKYLENQKSQSSLYSMIFMPVKKFVRELELTRLLNAVGQSEIGGSIPANYRGLCWCSLLRVQSRIEARPGYFAALCERCQTEPQCISEKAREQIFKDTPRTFPNIHGWSENYELRCQRILLAYALHNPTIGYAQSMNYIIACLLFFIDDDEKAFWAFCAITEDILEGYYTDTLIGVRIDTKLMNYYLKLYVKDVWKIFHELNIDLGMIIVPWIMCLFTQNIILETAFAIWDYIFLHGIGGLFYYTIRIFLLYKSDIVQWYQSGNVNDVTVIFTQLQTKMKNLYDIRQLTSIDIQPVITTERVLLRRQGIRIRMEEEQERRKFTSSSNQKKPRIP